MSPGAASSAVGSAFSMLLEATLEHLTDLRSRGVQFVDVDLATLKALSQPPARPVATPTTRPARAADPQPAPRSAAGPSSPSSKPPPAGTLGASGFLAQRPAAPSTPVPETPRVSPPALSATEKAAALDALRPSVLACQKCPNLVESRTQVVFGVGNPDAQLMFVGEAPGEAEDRAGEPFVGPAGQLLTKIIQAMGLSRETVYIANILKCRPNMPPGSRGNRAPRPEEMDTCKPHLLQQIDIIQPKIIVALGGTAVQGLLGLQTTMGSVRGRWHDFRGIPVMPTFHPSYLLRSEDGPDRGHKEKRKTWEDMLLVLDRLQLPITEKMRGFFLKPPSPTGGAGA